MFRLLLFSIFSFSTPIWASSGDCSNSILGLKDALGSKSQLASDIVGAWTKDKVTSGFEILDQAGNYYVLAPKLMNEPLPVQVCKTGDNFRILVNFWGERELTLSFNGGSTFEVIGGPRRAKGVYKRIENLQAFHDAFKGRGSEER